jgi:hypothetical protein
VAPLEIVSHFVQAFRVEDEPILRKKELFLFALHELHFTEVGLRCAGSSLLCPAGQDLEGASCFFVDTKHGDMT